MANNLTQQFISLWKEDVAYSRTITTILYQAWVRVERVLTPFRRQAKSVSVFAFALIVGAYVFFPTIANADVEIDALRLDADSVAMIISSMQNESEAYGRLPQAETASARNVFTIPITAYTSDPAQTDNTPCITASGLDVCERDIENVVAANFLPIGTRVRIPELFGDRVFYVEDRMNARYHYKMDIWMKDITEARQFGLQYATIEVF